MSNLDTSLSINKLIGLILVVLFILVLSLLFWLKPTRVADNNNQVLTNATPVIVSNPPVAINTASSLETARVEHFIQGLATSPDGHLIISIKTQQQLDVFLGDQATELTDNYMAITKAQIQQTMKEPAATEAITLLEHYAAYKKALADMALSTPKMTQQNNDDNLMAGVKIQRISALRNEYLSPQIIQIFYAKEDAHTQYELSRQRIMSMNSLSDEQRQEELNALQNQLQQNTTSPH